MTNHLAAIREAAERIVANGREEWMGDKVLLLISSRLHGQEILRILDEAEKDSTTTATREVCYDHGEITNYGAYWCHKCGTKTLDTYPCCPGCGRRIERGSKSNA